MCPAAPPRRRSWVCVLVVLGNAKCQKVTAPVVEFEGSCFRWSGVLGSAWEQQGAAAFPGQCDRLSAAAPETWQDPGERQGARPLHGNCMGRGSQSSPHRSQAQPRPPVTPPWKGGSSLLLSKAPAEGSRGQALGPASRCAGPWPVRVTVCQASRRPPWVPVRGRLGGRSGHPGCTM